MAVSVFDDLDDFDPKNQEILKNLSQSGSMLSFKEIMKGNNGIDYPQFPPKNDNIFKEEWMLRTMEEIQKYYFPEVKPISKYGITINDSSGVFQDSEIVREVLIETVLVEGVSFLNVKSSRIELDKIDIVVFTSKDGAQLLRAWRNAKESVHKNPNTLALFMETDDNFNKFGSVMNFVVGSEVEKHFNSDYWKEVVEYVKKNELSISSKDIKKLVNNALSKQSFFNFLYQMYKAVKGKVKDVSLDLLSSVFKGLSDGIEKLKFTQDQWNINNPDFEAKKMPFFYAPVIDFSNETFKKEGRKFEKITENIFRDFKPIIEKIANILPKRLKQQIKQFVEAISKQIRGFTSIIIGAIKDLMTMYEYSQYLLNAFLCGFINGLLDLVKSIFDIIVLIIDVAKLQNDYEANKGYYTDLTIEYLENLLEAYLKFDFLAFAQKMTVLQLTVLGKMIKLITSLNLGNTNLTAVAYYSGFIIFGIVEIILEVLFTGGSATVVKLFKTGGDVMSKTVKAVMNVADDLLGMLRYLIRLFEKGVDEVVVFFKKIIDDFFDWLDDMFRRGKVDDVLDTARKVGSGGFLK